MGVLEGKKGMPKYSVKERTKLAAMAWMWETIHWASSSLSWKPSSSSTAGARTRRTSPMVVVGSVRTRLGWG